MLNENERYNGNASLKKIGISHSYTEEELKEFIKCMDDIVYFATKYVKIVNVDSGLIPFDVFDYQAKLLQHYQKNRFSIVLSSRQSGKCVCGNTIVSLKNNETGEIINTTIENAIGLLIKETIDE